MPEEDYGYFLVNVQLPAAASLQRTDAVCRAVDQVLLHTEGIAAFNTIAGFSLLSRVTASNYGFYFVGLKPWAERDGPDLEARAIVTRLNRALARAVPEGDGVRRDAAVDSGPRQPGWVLALAAGSERRVGRTPESERAEVPRERAPAPRARRRHDAVHRRRPAALRERRPRQSAEAGARAGRRVPDDAGVSRRVVREPVQPVRPAVARLPPGRRRRAKQHRRPSAQFYVRNNDGDDGAAVGAARRREPAFGPQYTNRFNVYRAALVTGAAAPGYSSGQALDALEDVARTTLPREIGYDWSDLSYQEKHAGSSGGALRAVDRRRVPDPRGALRELVASFLGAALGADCGIRRVRRPG